MMVPHQSEKLIEQCFSLGRFVCAVFVVILFSFIRVIRLKDTMESLK